MTQAEENEIASMVVEPEVAAALAEIKAVVHAHYEIDDDNFIDYAIALAIANKFDADPLWGFLVGPPSSLKTQILESFHGCPWIHLISSITPKTFISGWSNKVGKNCSLLPKLDKKVMVVKEFSSILQMRSDWRASVFNDLREIYDGRLSKGYGTGEVVEWYGKVGFIAAVTPEIERHTAVNQDLGERFLYYRMVVPDPHKTAACARHNAVSASSKRGDLSTASLDYLSLFSDYSNSAYVTTPDPMGAKLDALSVFCVRARTGVVRDRYDRARIDVKPETEGVGRLSGQLNLLAQALATARGIAGIDEGVYCVVKKVGRDLIPRRRVDIMQFMVQNRLDNPDQFYSSEAVGVRLSVPTQTCRYDLDDLFMVGILTKKLGMDRRTSLYQASDTLLSDAIISDVFG